MATGVDAFQVATIKDFARPLLGMPHDRGLAVFVGRWQVFAQRKPAQPIGLDLVQRVIGQVIGMNKKMRFGFEPRQAAAEEIDVVAWHDRGNFRRQGAGTQSVRLQRLSPSNLQPIGGAAQACKGIEKHFIVIAEDGNQLTLLFQLQQPIEHTARVRTAIDKVAERHDRVVRLRIDGR